MDQDDGRGDQEDHREHVNIVNKPPHAAVLSECTNSTPYLAHIASFALGFRFDLTSQYIQIPRIALRDNGTRFVKPLVLRSR